MLSQKTLKHLNKLQQKKYRKQCGEFLVEGIKSVQEALDSNAQVLSVVIEGNKRDEEEFKKLIELAEGRGVVVEFCGRKDVDQIKTTDTFPGVLAIIEHLIYSLEDVVDNKPIICLDNIKDPGNLGTIIRTADWFGVKNIILSEDSVDLYNPKVVRSTMGSIFYTKVFQSFNLVQTLKKLKERNDYQIAGLTMDGQNIDKLKPQSKIIYILGSESHGIRPEVEKILDKRYTIQGKGSSESLNVAITTGILLYNL